MMKTAITNVSLTLVLICTTLSCVSGQDMDYRMDGCIPVMPSSIHVHEERARGLYPNESTSSSGDLTKIWEEMESLALDMIDLEVEVLDLRSEQLKVIPFSKIGINPEEHEYDSLYGYPEEEESEGNDHITDKLRYEMLQMTKHLNSLVFEVESIRLQVNSMKPYSTCVKTGTTSAPLTYTIQPIRYNNSDVLQNGGSIERYWREMEEMAIQAMDLEVEISDLRSELAQLRRNSWELDQVSLTQKD